MTISEPMRDMFSTSSGTSRSARKRQRRVSLLARLQESRLQPLLSLQALVSASSSSSDTREQKLELNKHKFCIYWVWIINSYHCTFFQYYYLKIYNKIIKISLYILSFKYMYHWPNIDYKWSIVTFLTKI